MPRRPSAPAAFTARRMLIAELIADVIQQEIEHAPEMRLSG